MHSVATRMPDAHASGNRPKNLTRRSAQREQLVFRKNPPPILAAERGLQGVITSREEPLIPQVIEWCGWVPALGLAAQHVVHSDEKRNERR